MYYTSFGHKSVQNYISIRVNPLVEPAYKRQVVFLLRRMSHISNQ